MSCLRRKSRVNIPVLVVVGSLVNGGSLQHIAAARTKQETNGSVWLVYKISFMQILYLTQ